MKKKNLKSQVESELEEMRSTRLELEDKCKGNII